MEMMDFRQMPYERPDMEAMKVCYEDTIGKLNGAASEAERRGVLRGGAASVFHAPGKGKGAGHHDVPVLRAQHHRYHRSLL